MTAYDKVVKNKLGKEAWELLIQHVNEGKITSQHSNEIASLLAENLPGSKIFGEHMNRVKEDGWNNAEFRHILANWYTEELYDLDREAALIKLAEIFEDSTVGLSSIASKLRKLMPTERFVIVCTLCGTFCLISCSHAGRSLVTNRQLLICGVPVQGL